MSRGFRLLNGKRKAEEPELDNWGILWLS